MSTAAPGADRRLRPSIGAVAIAVALGCYFGHVFRSLEEKTVDARFDMRGSRTPSDVVVVAVDDATFNDAADLPWPFPRCPTRT